MGGGGTEFVMFCRGGGGRLRMFCKGGRSLWVSRATNSRATNRGGGAEFVMFCIVGGGGGAGCGCFVRGGGVYGFQEQPIQEQPTFFSLSQRVADIDNA